jgi:hypothetical protein
VQFLLVFILNINDLSLVILNLTNSKRGAKTTLCYLAVLSSGIAHREAVNALRRAGPGSNPGRFMYFDAVIST